MADPHDETYIGDGLYASFDGLQIQLRAPRPTRDGGDQTVFLDAEVLVEFEAYVSQLRKRIQREYPDVPAAQRWKE